MNKECNICEESKNEKEFYKDSKLKDGLFNFCKDCDREKYKESRSKRRNERHLRFKLNKPASFRFTQYQSRCKIKNRVFNLSFEEFEEIANKPCSYCGDKKSMGIDRSDNEIGYTVKNSVPSCLTCNMMKRLMGSNDFIKQCKKISNNN